MSLPVHIRIAAFLAAATTATVIIDVMAELGHPDPAGSPVLAWILPQDFGALAGLLSPAVAAQPLLASGVGEAP